MQVEIKEIERVVNQSNELDSAVKLLTEVFYILLFVFAFCLGMYIEWVF